MTKEELLSLCEKYSQGTATAEEREAVEDFYKRMQERPVDLPWDFTREEQLRLRMLKRILTQVSPQPERIVTRYYMQIAAAVALFIMCAAAVAYMMLPKEVPVEMITYTTHGQQRMTATLPDSSVVHLNLGSSLSFPKHFTGAERKVTLQGEAFFVVAHDAQRPFLVETASLTTRVLGTQFNVRAYHHEPAEVAVASGRVRVTGGETAVELTTNQQAMVATTGAAPVVITADAERIAGWRNSLLAFDMVPFDQALQQLSRWYHVPILLNPASKSDCLIRARFDNSQEITHILEGLKNIVDFNYVIKPDHTITITYSACKN